MKCDFKIYGIEERKDNILYNKEMLNIKDEDVLIQTKEKRTTPQDRWPFKMLKKVLLSSFKRGITHRVILQDDVELCPNFVDYVNRVVNAHPNAIYMLTALDFRTKNDYGDSLKTPYVKVGQFVSGCALIIPKDYCKDLITWMEDKYPQIGIGNPHEDTAIKLYARAYGIDCLTTIPSLVQHLGDVSTCCNYKQPLRTAYFENWDKADWECLDVAKAYINQKEFIEYLRKEHTYSKNTTINKETKE